MKSKLGSSKKKKTPAKQIKDVMEPSKDMSVNVRKIENGFIVRKSGSGKDGRYIETEVYYEKNPLDGI